MVSRKARKDLKRNLINELYKPARKTFARRKFIQRGIGDTLQTDLVVFNDYVKENRSFRYLLTVIDVFTKKVWAAPLKTKTNSEVAKAFEQILNKIKYKIKNVQSDQGLEYFGKHFGKLMQDRKINHYHTYSHLKASICERMQRTIKTNLYKEMAYKGTHNWVDNFQKVIDVYNNTPHRGIGKLTPNSVNKSKEKLLLDTVYSNPKLYIKPKFSVGTYVRLSKYKKHFDKSYHMNFTVEVFYIDKVHQTMPPTYSIRDLNGQAIYGKFYEFEIQKVANKDLYLVEKVIKRRGDKLLVKWIGFPDATWISKNAIV